MSIAVLRRLAAMQPGELRFRVQSEVRKTASRVRGALFTSRWNRAALAPLLRIHGGRSASWTAAMEALRNRDYGQAHRFFAAHFSRRTTPFPIGSASLARLAATIEHDFPGAAAHAAGRADAIVGGHYDLLGYRGLECGQPPDWHRDPVHDRRSPRVFWASVPYLDPAAGDHKVIWELNRHQHWLALGRAFALSGDRRYYQTFTSELESWLTANPPLIGTNWASMLELGLRSIAWMGALEYFAGAAGGDDREPWIVDMLLALDRQLAHVEQNLSHYFSPNTHLTGEALALYVAGLVLPEFKASARRTAVGREVLVREATRQVRSDGGHAELSPHYHRYSTDFFLLALTVARQAADSAEPVFEEAARRQARYLRTIVDDAGVRPPIGDDDGGQLWPVCGRDSADCRDTLATAAVLLNESALIIGRIPEETYWMCGQDGRREAADATCYWMSTALPASGYYVSRTARGDHLIFDAGPHGFLTGGHAHADALSCTLSIDGQPVLIDPGTATYTMDPELRDRFRSTRMHNTVVIDGRVQAEPNGPFQWKSIVTAQARVWHAASDCDYVEGTHESYAPRRHTRAVLAVHGFGWWILDHILGDGPAVVESYWHFHPSWRCRLESDRSIRLDNDGQSLALASTYRLSLLAPGGHPLAVYSPAYGVVEGAPVGYGRAPVSLPTTLATFIPAKPEIAEQLQMEAAPIVEAPGPDWHAAAFRVRWARGTTAILAAIERTGVASSDTAAPPERWGTAELQTDARVAMVSDHAAARSDLILVNGAFIDAHPAHSLISLPRPVQLIRLFPARVAPSVHEVGANVRPQAPRGPEHRRLDV